MGYATASDLATSTDLRQAVSIHFASNCYPPIPQYMLDTAMEAIDLCADNNSDEKIDLPEGVLFRGQTHATAGEIVEGQHLDAFVHFLYQTNWATPEELNEANS
jgi:hypothetical protein